MWRPGNETEKTEEFEVKLKLEEKTEWTWKRFMKRRL